LRALERRETALERAHGRVREARVEIALAFPGEARGGVGGAARDEARRRENRLRVLVLRGRAPTRAHRTGVESPAFVFVLDHVVTCHRLPATANPKRGQQKTRSSSSSAGGLALAAFVTRPQAEAQIGASIT